MSNPPPDQPDQASADDECTCGGLLPDGEDADLVPPVDRFEESYKTVVEMVRRYLGDDAEVITALPGSDGLAVLIVADTQPTLFRRIALDEDLQRVLACRVDAQVTVRE